MSVTVPTSTTAYLLLPQDESEVDVTRLQDGQKAVTEKGRRVALNPGRYELILRP